MNKKLITLSFIFSFLAQVVYSQVNLQTGSATFSLPMFNWKDDKSRLYSTVALNYNSGNGLKVNEIASNVGQGWSLLAGGAIIRLQVGEPDDQVARNGTESDLTKYPSGILNATVPASNGCPTALTRYPIYGSKNQLYTQRNIIAEDKQLDYFSFQFNGKAGMFVLDPANIGTAQPLGDTKMKISFQRDPSWINYGLVRNDIMSFTITDVDGLIYKFNRLGLSKILQLNFCDESLNYYRRQPELQNGKVYHQAGFDIGQLTTNKFIINGWYLSEIEDGLTHRKITILHDTRFINSEAGQDIVYNTYTNGTQYSIVSHKTSISETPAITSITYPDGHVATFTYGEKRIDLKGDKALASVDFSYNGRYLSRYILNTTYVIRNRYGKPVTKFQKKVARLYLKSVQKIGVDLKEETNPYIFDYFLGSGNGDDFVPSPFSYSRDIWGFYNGNNNVGYNNQAIPVDGSISGLNNNQLKGLCYLNQSQTGVILNAKSGYAKNGLLKRIIYPTGGSLNYDYEQNSGVLNGTVTVIGGVHVSQTSSTDGGYSNDCNNPIKTNYQYVLNGQGSSSSLWGIEMPENKISGSNHYAPERRYHKWTWSCPIFGCCYWKYQYPGILLQQQTIDLKGFQRFMEAAAPVFGVLTVLTTIVDVVNLILGPTPLAIVAVVIDVIAGLATLLISCLSNPEDNKNYTIYYNSDLNGAAPLPVQFKRVEVTESPGTIGKTVHEFTSSDDYPIWEPANPLFSAKQRFATWAYGLPKLTTFFSVNGDKVREIENVYDYANAKSLLNSCSSHPGTPPCGPGGINSTLISCKCVVTKSSSIRNTDWSDPNQYNAPTSYLTASNSDLKVDFYGMYTGRTELKTTKERSFRENNASEYLESVTDYFYNSGWRNYEIYRIITRESNGVSSSKTFTYASDYWNETPVLNKLFEKNILVLPVSIITRTYDLSVSLSDRMQEERVTEFIELTNGDIRPTRVLEQRFAQPSSTATAYTPTNPNNSSIYKVAETFTYDGAGNLIGVKDEGNRFVTNIYDYNDKFVVASVINADPLTDNCSYTSFETTNYGGWLLNGTASIVTPVNGSLTGIRAFGLTTSNSLSRSLNTTKAYKLSFWTSNGAATVSGGASLIKNSPTVNGFTYYEYDISQGTASVTITGTCNIDELRLYPASARMRTVTYDPLIGKIAESDENNRLTYYEYDNLGRLLFVKDENKNAIKMYEYNIISEKKQTGCPAVYYNGYISETFTKNNCGPGYVGGDVSFFVPANKYSSTISQTEADAQAEIDLQTNGQAYANANGTCILVYYNTAQSKTDTTETCAEGYKGGTVVYTVPAARYSSLISQADADQKAFEDIAANSKAYANDPANAVCSVNTDPEWSWSEGSPSYCLSVNGNLPPHLFLQATDINPNSPSYQQTAWKDAGTSDQCPSNTYYNAERNGAFTKNNCEPGYSGSTVTYTVPPGKYSSTSSQAAADQLAQNDINANGQNYANTYGNCNSQNVDLYYSFGPSPGDDYGVVTLYNNNGTGPTYYFQVFTNYYQSYLGSVPAGSYTVTFEPYSGGYNYHFGAGCDFSTNGPPPLTLYDISLSQSCYSITLYRNY